MFNGVDVSDPTRTFSQSEMDKLGVAGRQDISLTVAIGLIATVGGGSRGSRGGGHGGQRNISATESSMISNITEGSESTNPVASIAQTTTWSVDNNTNDSTTSSNTRGGQNGGRFGRGAYSHGRGCSNRSFDAVVLSTQKLMDGGHQHRVGKFEQVAHSSDPNQFPRMRWIPMLTHLVVHWIELLNFLVHQ